LHHIETIPEKAILVGVRDRKSTANSEESIAELGRLVVSAGGSLPPRSFSASTALTLRMWWAKASWMRLRL